jgi:major membrane immunogen (membrane-anchored lipoprotein)
MVKSGIGLVLAACFFLPACGSDDEAPKDETATDAIEIEGSWTATFAGQESGDEEINDEAWTSFATQAIVEFSNEDNYAIWQNPDDAQYNPSLFGQNVWTEVEDGSFYYCTVAYMSETAEATEADAEPTHTSDLDNAGCGAMDAPWTKLTRK